MCPAGQLMYFYKEFTQPSKDSDKLDKKESTIIMMHVKPAFIEIRA